MPCCVFILFIVENYCAPFTREIVFKLNLKKLILSVGWETSCLALSATDMTLIWADSLVHLPACVWLWGYHLDWIQPGCSAIRDLHERWGILCVNSYRWVRVRVRSIKSILCVRLQVQEACVFSGTSWYYRTNNNRDCAAAKDKYLNTVFLNEPSWTWNGQ